MKKINTILIPDVHGRKFWKEVIGHNERIVFLGDYVAPYSNEGITHQDALENFKEIIDFAKNNDNVQLLYGNHDCEYSIGQDVCCCRTDYDNFDEIRNLFLDNKGLFKFSHTVEVNSRKIVLSHSGFHPHWVSKHGITPETINTYLDDEDKFDKLHTALCDISHFRGGFNSAGSVIWSDIREYFDVKMSDDYEQIVGHTMLNGDKPIMVSNIMCIDLQKPFAIDEDGEILNIDGSKVEVMRF